MSFEADFKVYSIYGKMCEFGRKIANQNIPSYKCQVILPYVIDRLWDFPLIDIPLVDFMGK